jgi:large subunit ribosomal protein L25
MATAIKLAATTRTRAGKGMARATRRENRIPCVIYGGKLPPQMISIDIALLEKQAHASNFVTHVYDIEVDGKTIQVLPRDVQFHPINDRPIHIDFLRISADSQVTVEVPFEFINADAAPGIKRGGTLNIVHHEIEVKCRPSDIPGHLTIDLAGGEIGTSYHVSAIALPKGVTLVAQTHDKDFTIATITAPSALRGKEEEADAAAATAASAAATPAAAAAAPAPDAKK